jgi:ATP-dependent RNA helicase RhlE
MSFNALGLCDELLNTVAKQGYTKPSPIQTEAIPAVLSKCDVMAVAQTGTGKTAAFTLPIVQLLSSGANLGPLFVRALIVTPTRELAAQVAQSVENYSSHTSLNSAAVFGGVRIEPQIFQLQQGVDIVVATPGRLLDLHNQQAINFDKLEILVLDEADRMLDMGFIDDIRRIQLLLPKKRQTLMFSATFTTAIKDLAKSMLQSPHVLEVTAANSLVDTIKQKLHPIDKERKSEALIHLIKSLHWQQVLVFTKTKRGADSLVKDLESAAISADSIHANRTQRARTLALAGFKNGSISILVATDIASRGIDIDQLPYVVNFDLPYVPEDYVHRIGRTGRAGAMGLAVSFFSDDETKQLQSIERMIGRKFEREIISGFAPSEKAAVMVPAISDTEEYGNFEADITPKRKGKSRGRNNRRRR